MAPLNPRPKLAPGVVVRTITGREESYVIVKEPESQQYFKFEEWEADLLGLLDGTRDCDELAARLKAAQPGRGIDAQFVVDAVEGYRELGVLERTEQERHLVMMEKLKSVRKQRFGGGEKLNIFQIDIKMFDPDPLLDRVMPWIGWIWSPWFVGPWIVIFAIVLGAMAYHWHLYWAGFFSLWNLPEKGPWDWVAMFALLVGVSVWHELGHGSTCKRFGGEVHDIGFMIFYLQPAFYCRTDDSYLFESRAQRIYTTFGGAYFELMLCSVAAAVWILSPAEWAIHGIALTLVFFTGLSAIVLNINPLIRLDGYYVLMDWLDVPNLREDSFQYIGNFFKKNLFHLETPATPIPKRRRRIYLIYGLLSIAYTTTLMLVLYTFFRRWFVGWLGPAGYLALAGGGLWLFRGKLKEAGRFARHLWLDKRDMLLQPRRAGIGALLLAAVALLAFVPRSATRIDGSFVVAPSERSIIRAPVNGIVRELLVKEGDPVVEGQVLARLESADIGADLSRARSEIDRLGRQSAAEFAAGRISAGLAGQDEGRGAEARLAVARATGEALTIRAPIAGVMVTRDLESRLGAALDAGDPLCEVDRISSVRLQTRIPENDIEEIAPGTPVRILAAAFSSATMRSEVVSISPRASEPKASDRAALDLIQRVNLMTVDVEIDNSDGRLRPGMTGRVQFLTADRSLAAKAWRGFSRWAGSLLW